MSWEVIREPGEAVRLEDLEPALRITKDVVGINHHAAIMLSMKWGTEVDLLRSDEGRLGVKLGGMRKARGKGATFIVNTPRALYGHGMKVPSGWLAATFTPADGILWTREPVPLE